ncbi:MAG: hypothetical protein JJU45_19140 [Acidimicrobiia bacterium]|nr:hypothetical protein [Acidimicrobiia bacterium]
MYTDGHLEGFQAKFHNRLQDALGGMRESVVAVCETRPSMTKLTFVVPYDFTDSGSAGRTTDQDRWESAVERWRKDIPGAKNVTFGTVRAGDITAKLALGEHRGRREYWFGGLEIGPDWFLNQFEESIKVAGSRYTPEADTESSINLTIDAVAAGARFRDRLSSLAAQAIAAARQDTGVWEQDANTVGSLLEQLEVARLALLREDASQPLASQDVTAVEGIAFELSRVASARLEGLEPIKRRNLDEALSAFQALWFATSDKAAKAFARRQLAIIGPAGQGKTHTLMRAVRGCLDHGVPAIAILGQRLSDKNWWPAVADSLGGLAMESDVFLQALDSLAEASGSRALVVFDAINESQAPHRWRDELPALLTQFGRYDHLALIVSFRTDYFELLGPPDSLMCLRHPGLSGHEAEALSAYCGLFKIPVPVKAHFDPALSSPLFLRMYCEVVAADDPSEPHAPSRSELFRRYTEVVGAKVLEKLKVAPSSTIVEEAITWLADEFLANDGKPLPRTIVEQRIDEFLPERDWPNTLFQQLASEGLIELRPSFDGTESVAFPFQAYSEHLLAERLLSAVDRRTRPRVKCTFSPLRKRLRLRRLRRRAAAAPWSWRTLAILLPEREEIELVDLLGSDSEGFRLTEATRESLVDRSQSSFGPRALQLLEEFLRVDADGESGGVEAVLSIAPREKHPGNADWLHQRLTTLSMADRDATWSIATFNVEVHSPAYGRLSTWIENQSAAGSDEELRLASIALMWLLTSPNRFLRDRTSKTLITILAEHLGLAANLVAVAKVANDPYVQERVLTCTYGAILIGGDEDLDGARRVLEEVSTWHCAGLPIDVLARDSARGIAAWCADRQILDAESLTAFEPPYEAAPPEEPPSREELESRHGPVVDGEGNHLERHATSILRSCLDWYGDFNRYVVRGDVEFFSWYPLSDPSPSSSSRDNPLDRVDVDWSGRWIADRAISLGWTAKRFEAFESDHDLRRGRDAHKAERFGKKYQWIALRELLARLADNYHPAFEPWNPIPALYQGPWAWSGRDFDPTLPPSATVDGSNVCRVAVSRSHAWAALSSPDMDCGAMPNDWVAMTRDLPSQSAVFGATAPDGQRWVALQRYSAWDRDNAQHTGLSQRARDIFFLQFAWLVPAGLGTALLRRIEEIGLAGRWMPDTSRMRDQYLGEGSSAPIVACAPQEAADWPAQLQDGRLQPRPAVEQYLWEGNTLDCSIDESVDLYAPTPELLGDARWVGRHAAWALDGTLVVQAVEVPGSHRHQDVLLARADWLTARLKDLRSDIVIGTLSERHARPADDVDYQRFASSDICYGTLLPADDRPDTFGPNLTVRGRVRD